MLTLKIKYIFQISRSITWRYFVQDVYKENQFNRL